jgi:hypothetical protein
MEDKTQKYIAELKVQGLSPQQEIHIEREMQGAQEHFLTVEQAEIPTTEGIYDKTDWEVLLGFSQPKVPYYLGLQTIDELLEQDKQREKDGFPRRIRLGKLMKPSDKNKSEVIIVPSTVETKFYHHDSPEEESQTGGVGEGEVGDVVGESPAQPQGQKGEGAGAGQGQGGEHDVVAQAFDLGKILTEKFELPNLKDKGKKPSLTKVLYDLTDINRGFGQLLDNKMTMKRIIQSNIMLGTIKPEEPVKTDELLINPKDKVYRIMSPEKDYDSQAVVFFLRDYSGSMQGKPTEVISTQHLLIYAWLMYQYQNNVMSRFILHDTEAKEVADFYTYYQSTVAGGTNVYPAFELVDKIITEENLAKDYNIYIFHGTDGDDWDNSGEKVISLTRKMLGYVNRIGITVAKNSWSNSDTTVERYMQSSGILKSNPELIKMDSMFAEQADESRMIEGIRTLIS